jgi:methyl-accepting chemotaxis protein
VAQAGSTILEVVASVGRVTAIVNDIAHARWEQSAGIELVNQAIGGMDQATQQNAALVEQATAASQALNAQARHLSQLVGSFKIDEPRPATAPSSGRAHPVGPGPITAPAPLPRPARAI